MQKRPLNKNRIKKLSFSQRIWAFILSIFSMIKVFFETFLSNEKDMEIRRELNRSRFTGVSKDPIKFGCGPSG